MSIINEIARIEHQAELDDTSAELVALNAELEVLCAPRQSPSGGVQVDEFSQAEYERYIDLHAANCAAYARHRAAMRALCRIADADKARAA